jgi:PhnB protein
MPGVETYLTFNGNCADAVKFYEKTLGAKVEFMMTHGESPMADRAPADFKNQIMHSTISIDGTKIMASDNMPGAPYNGMQGFTLSLTYQDIAEAERIFSALAAGGKVVMPYAEQFWVERWGAVNDKFGTPWMVSGGKSKMG